MVITPTVGRVVWIRNRPLSHDVAQPEAALVTYVHNDRLINVAGFDANGKPFAITSLWLEQDGGPDIGYQTHAEWMPYQKGQAANDWDRIVEKGNDPEAVRVFSDKLDAAVKMVRGDPAPSPEFRDLSTRKRTWTPEECQTMVNGALLALVAKTPGDRLRITTDQIFAAHSRLGSLALALSDDDKLLTITGLKST